MQRILVTGGAGFIGSHTSLLLLENGYEIVVIDSFVNSSPLALKRVEKILENQNIKVGDKLKIFKGDLRNENDIERVFFNFLREGKTIDAVIHFAGLKSVSESFSNPIKYWDYNLIGTINLLKTMEKFSCFNIVFSSSATIYKPSKNKFLSEDEPISPINPYGATKVAIENFLNDLQKSSNNIWRIAKLRYFNPIGAHHSGLIGESPLGLPNNIYPQLTKVALGEIKELIIYGDDWQTEDGTGVRDFIHVMDLAKGHLLVLEFLDRNPPQVLDLNLGTGNGTSVLELIKIFQEINKVKIPYVIGPRRKGDIDLVVADITRAKYKLNWEPENSIDDMCKDGWNWQLQNPHGFSERTPN